MSTVNPSSQRFYRPLSTSSLILGLLICIHVVCIIILDTVPPISRDALIHHLAVPKLYIQKGMIFEIPELGFSYYPMNLDLLYMIPLWFGNDIIPKYIHFSFALMTAAILYHYLSNRLSKNYGLFGALFFLTIPIIVKLSITAYVDLGLIFFTTAALILLLYWTEQKKTRHLIAAGACSGLAAGTKYNGMLPILLLTLLIPLLYQRSRPQAHQSSGRAMGCAALFLLAALISFSPWLVRNYHWTGNPVYPLYNSIFQKEKNNGDAAEKSSGQLSDNLKKITLTGSNIFVIRANVYHEPWWQVMLLPVRLFFEGRDDDPRYFDGQLSPFLLFLPLFAFLLPPPNQKRQIRFEIRFVFAFSFCLFCLTFFLGVTRIRYLAPIIPPLVILSTFGLHNLVEKAHDQQDQLRKTILKVIITVTLALLLLGNTSYLVKQFKKYTPFDYLSGKISRSDYITRHRPEYPLIEFINANLPAESRILAVFLGSRGYYFDRAVSFDLQAGRSRLCEISRQSRDAGEIAEALRNLRITHLIIRYDLFLQWTQQQLSPEEHTRLNQFFQNHTKLLAEDNGYGIVEIIW